VSQLSIVLRTVCGCERILGIPFKQYPPSFEVPYMRNGNEHFYPADGESCMVALKHRRVFKNTHRLGTYGYPVYLEVLEGEKGQP
jgi:hypothetical protein